MPQIIESYIRQAGPLQDRFEVLVDQAIHIHWPAEFLNKDQVNGFWPFFGANKRMCRLEFPQLLQSRENPILQSDQPSTAGPFCLAILPLSRESFPQRPFNADGCPFPIEVLPLEADSFARAHPGCNCDSEESPVHRW